jgi:nicotinamide phosphoribosyltransferase
MSKVKNGILKTDMYVYSHPFLLPPAAKDDIQVAHLYNRAKPMILMGFNRLVRETLKKKYTIEMINEAEPKIIVAGLPFDRITWERVVNECNGYLPLKIESLPDGTYCPKGTPFCQIFSTKPGFGSLVEFVEAQLMKGYFASACATKAWEIRNYLKSVGLPANQVHSFGFRGHRSEQDAEACTEAMALFLPSSDDSHGLEICPDAKITSIPALSHYVVQQWDSEFECYVHAIEFAATQPAKIVAIVIDTYSAIKFIEHYLILLATLAKKLGVRVVFRPDSGNTVQQMIDIYKILKASNLENDHNVIIGEGITLERIKEIHKLMSLANVPLPFCFFGMGGGFYNDIERDTLGWAQKLAQAGARGRMKFSENPIKRSIPGIVKLSYIDGGRLKVFDITEAFVNSEYQTIYEFNPDKRKTPKVKKTTWKQAKFLVENYEFNKNQANYEQESIDISTVIKERIESIEAERLG